MMSRRRTMTGIATAAIALGMAFPAAAATSYPGGGVWNYGVNEVVFSSYYHATATHGASVRNGWGTRVSSGCVVKGKTARAEAPARKGEPDYAYWSKSSCGG